MVETLLGVFAALPFFPSGTALKARESSSDTVRVRFSCLGVIKLLDEAFEFTSQPSSVPFGRVWRCITGVVEEDADAEADEEAVAATDARSYASVTRKRYAESRCWTSATTESYTCPS